MAAACQKVIEDKTPTPSENLSFLLELGWISLYRLSISKYNADMTNNNTMNGKEMTSELSNSEFFIATVNGWFITIRCTGSSAEYYIAKKHANGRMLIKTSKSLSYIKNSCK